MQRTSDPRRKGQLLVAGGIPRVLRCLDWHSQVRRPEGRTALTPMTRGGPMDDVRRSPDLRVGSGQVGFGEFPKATFAIVAGAGHDAAASFYGSCAGRLIATFLDTLRADPKACATLGS